MSHQDLRLLVLEAELDKVTINAQQLRHDMDGYELDTIEECGTSTCTPADGTLTVFSFLFLLNLDLLTDFCVILLRSA